MASTLKLLALLASVMLICVQSSEVNPSESSGGVQSFPVEDARTSDLTSELVTKLGVAEAKLGVAEAKLGVAEAKLGEEKKRSATMAKNLEDSRASDRVVKDKLDEEKKRSADVQAKLETMAKRLEAVTTMTGPDTKALLHRDFAAPQIKLCPSQGSSDDECQAFTAPNKRNINLGASWFDGGAGENSSHTGTSQSCIDASNCNPAKCFGSWQNSSHLYGDLDCESDPRQSKAKHKGSKCLDNLSSGGFYTPNVHGHGICYSFDHEKAVARTTLYVQSPGHVRDGVISKMAVAHPHLTKRKYGLIGAKRILCAGTTCSVFKVGMCIKCPKNVFRDDFEHKATQEDFSKFVQCCILGQASYKKYDTDETESESCHADFGTGAFTAVNDASATLKPGYECWNGDETDTEGKEAHEVSTALLKAL